MRKERIRKIIKEKRRKQIKEENRKKSKEIKEKLFNLKEYKEANTILFYVSYNCEVFTHDMIREALKEKVVVVPISNKENFSIKLSKLGKLTDLKTSSYNILEPRKECIKDVAIDVIDLIIVPGVAFDCRGNRLGHGKGYYDRLLRNAKGITKIGLTFEFQIVENITIEKHDISMDKIITEKRIIDREKN
jgi:5-formyltetrahydrofolate cyclo-ligase